MPGLLSWFVLAPVAAAAAVWLLPRAFARWLALLGSLVALGIGAWVLDVSYTQPEAGFRFMEDIPWSATWGASWHLGADGLSAAMMALSGLIGLVATVSAWRQDRHPRAYHSLVLLLLAGINGVFVSLDLLLFYICWEVMLVPMLLLIGYWGGAQRRYAALKFFAFTLAGSVLMLAAIVGLWVRTPPAGREVTVAACEIQAYSSDGGQTVHGLRLTRHADGEVTAVVPRDFDIRHLKLQWKAWQGERFLGLSLAAFGFLACAIAFAVKVPLVPLHTWLPHAHVQAPTAISVILAGVLLKLGVYGFLRVAWPLFPIAAVDAGPFLGFIGVAGVLWAAYVALMQDDLKRLVAYSSVSHMGYCLLGLTTLTVSGVCGAMVQMVTHGIGSAMLFLLVGVLYDRAHHRRMDGFGGLAKPMPVFASVLLLAALTACGLPALAGFPGEFMAVMGAFTAAPPGAGPWYFPALGIAATLAVILAAAYLLTMVMRVAYGPLKHPEQAEFKDLDFIETSNLVPLVGLSICLGVLPQPLVNTVRPVAEALIAHVQQAVR